jgi:hypothetical protein
MCPDFSLEDNCTEILFSQETKVLLREKKRFVIEGGEIGLRDNFAERPCLIRPHLRFKPHH